MREMTDFFLLVLHITHRQLLHRKCEYYISFVSFRTHNKCKLSRLLSNDLMTKKINY